MIHSRYNRRITRARSRWRGRSAPFQRRSRSNPSAAGSCWSSGAQPSERPTHTSRDKTRRRRPHAKKAQLMTAADTGVCRVSPRVPIHPSCNGKEPERNPGHPLTSSCVHLSSEPQLHHLSFKRYPSTHPTPSATGIRRPEHRGFTKNGNVCSCGRVGYFQSTLVKMLTDKCSDRNQSQHCINICTLFLCHILIA